MNLNTGAAYVSVNVLEPAPGALVAASLAAEAAGHSGLSWLADGAATAAWLLFRLARR